MKSYRALCIGPLVLLIVIAGCGGGSGFDPNKVVVIVSPATVAIPASGQVTLQASVTSSPAPVVNWFIAELTTNGASGAQCNWVGGTPPAGPCPDGTIQQVTVGNSQTVTYYAPGISGTFHVIAEWTLWGSPVIKEGTSVITVGP